MRAREFERLWPQVQQTVNHLSWRLARTQFADWREDLLQAACLKLLRLPYGKPRAFYITACYRAMIDEFRRMDPRRYMSFREAHRRNFDFVWERGRLRGRYSVRRKPGASPAWGLDAA